MRAGKSLDPCFELPSTVDENDEDEQEGDSIEPAEGVIMLEQYELTFSDKDRKQFENDSHEKLNLETQYQAQSILAYLPAFEVPAVDIIVDGDPFDLMVISPPDSRPLSPMDDCDEDNNSVDDWMEGDAVIDSRLDVQTFNWSRPGTVSPVCAAPNALIGLLTTQIVKLMCGTCQAMESIEVSTPLNSASTAFFQYTCSACSNVQLFHLEPRLPSAPLMEGIECDRASSPRMNLTSLNSEIDDDRSDDECIVDMPANRPRDVSESWCASQSSKRFSASLCGKKLL